MVVPDVRGMMLTKLAAFLGRPQCLSFRPEDSQRHKSPYKEIPIQPYDRLISMHCAWRRAVAVFSSSPPDSDPSHLKEAADSADQRLLRLYARREDIARILRARPSADHLTLLTLGESAWVHLATTSEISPSSPLHLTGLACLEIFFQNCSTYGSNSMEIGLWPEVKLFAALHLPKLDILHLVHLIPIMHRGQCSSAVRERTLGHTMGRCWCRNSGIVAMEQVLDLLAHRAPGFDQLPQLILSGVSSIVDDDPPSTRARFESHVSEVLINADVADEQMQHINMHNRYYRHALTRRLPDYDYNNFWY
ncbi:hypothetical protein BKA62DRAFT_776365 [Auriculariales sp. MPI-PUGE-AT-0066]|nr:hypothetical protein BKA62DRAFT_776365 [Auriculariales sp. MPI-PUGE-AT-0066]